MCIKEMQVTVLVKNYLEMKNVLLISVIMLFSRKTYHSTWRTCFKRKWSVDLKTMDARKLMNRRLRDVVEISQSVFAGSYDGLRENRKIETESFMMAATFTCTNIRREDLPEGNEINMCKAMDQLFQRMRDEGKLNTLKELLKVKLGTLSRPLEKQLTNTSLEKLNVLTLNIFNINSEEDVLKIIN